MEERTNDESFSLVDYIIVGVVFAIIVLSLYFLFMLDTSVPVKEVPRDSLLIKEVQSHEERLNRIDTIHMKLINQK